MNDSQVSYSSPTGINAPFGQKSLNAMTTAFHWGKYSTPELQEGFHTTNEIPSLFISVHAYQTRLGDYIRHPFNAKYYRLNSGFTDRLISQMLSQPHFQNTPRLYLVNKDYPITSPDYLRHATALFHSIAGEIDLQFPVAGEYHIVGQELQQCLARTLQTIGDRDLVNTPNKESTVFVYSNHVLATNGDGINQASITDIFPMNTYQETDYEELILSHLLPQRAHAARTDRILKEFFIFSYDSENRSMTIENLENNSVLRIVIK